jgi:hypothetical protein
MNSGMNIMSLKATIISYFLLFLTQEKSFDLESTDPCGSLKVVNLWLETDVIVDKKLRRSSVFCVQVTST